MGEVEGHVAPTHQEHQVLQVEVAVDERSRDQHHCNTSNTIIQQWFINEIKMLYKKILKNYTAV